MLKNPRYLTSAYHYFLAAIDLSSDRRIDCPGARLSALD
jgi:hypothetical protein